MTVSLLPEKHIRTSESLLGIGAVVLATLKGEAKTLDALLTAMLKREALSQRLHGSVTIENVVLAIDFLYAIGAVQLTEEGLLAHATA